MDLWTPIWTTLRVGVGATLIAFPLGVLTAHFLLRAKFRLARWMEAAILLPLLLTPPALGFLPLLLLTGVSPVRLLAEYAVKVAPVLYSESFATVAAVLYTAPLVALLSVWAMRSVPMQLQQVGEVLGLNPWQVFWRITVPLTRHSLAAIAVLGFARAAGEYGVYILVGPYLAGHAMPLSWALIVGFHNGQAPILWLLLASATLSTLLLLAAFTLRRGGRLL